MRTVEDRHWFVLLSVLVFVYVAARAALVPFVHDEAATYSMYVQMREFLPWRSHWDAGNHFLSTGLGIAADRLFGMHQWALRGANVFAFLLYAVSAWRLGARVKDRSVRWCMLAGLLLCPFTIEFFSLFRGYGLAMAFFLLGIDGLVRFLGSGRLKHLAQVLCGMALACACILSLLTLWAMVLALLLVLLAVTQRSAGERLRLFAVWSLLGAAPFLPALFLSREMQAIGLFYYGSLDGFVQVTLRTLCQYVLGTQQLGVMLIVALLLAGVTAVAVRQWRSSGTWRHPLVVCTGLLWGDVLARVLMALLLKVNYPEDRAALHMVPLYILVLAFAADALATAVAGWRYAALPLLYLPLRVIATANLTHTDLWPDQSPPVRFVQRLVELQAQQERALAIGAYHQMNRSLPFAARLMGAELPMPLTGGFPSGPHDVRIARPDHRHAAGQGFRQLDHDPATGLSLLQREVPLLLSASAEHRFAPGTTSNEFIEVLNADTLSDGTDRLVEVVGRLRAEVRAQVKLVVEVRTSTDSLLYYDAILVTAFAPEDHRFTAIRHIPYMRPQQRAVVYFWNMRSLPVTIDEGSLRLYTIDER